MTQTIIPAGYRLSITSWENDADAYHTEIVEGISKERVEFILELCRLFRSKNQKPGCFGNMYDDYSNRSDPKRKQAYEAIAVVMEKHRPVLTECELANLDAVASEEDEPEFAEIVSNFLHYGENFVFRVYDGAKVEYIPHEIRMDDVTGQFKT
jgi:hypothetical protein